MNHVILIFFLCLFIYLFCVGGRGWVWACTSHGTYVVGRGSLDGAGVFLLPVRGLQELNARLQAFTASVTTYGPTLPGPLK